MSGCGEEGGTANPLPLPPQAHLLDLKSHLAEAEACVASSPSDSLQLRASSLLLRSDACELRGQSSPPRLQAHLKVEASSLRAEWAETLAMAKQAEVSSPPLLSSLQSLYHLIAELTSPHQTHHQSPVGDPVYPPNPPSLISR